MLNIPFPFEVEVVSYQTSARVIRGVGLLVLPPMASARPAMLRHLKKVLLPIGFESFCAI